MKMFSYKDIPGASEQIFLILWYCYRSYKKLSKDPLHCINRCVRPRF